MIDRKWDIQAATNWWVSLGFHIDHTDPSLTIHLPGAIICLGRCKQPGFAWSLRRWIYGLRIRRLEKITRTIGEAGIRGNKAGIALRIMLKNRDELGGDNHEGRSYNG